MRCSSSFEKDHSLQEGQLSFATSSESFAGPKNRSQPQASGSDFVAEPWLVTIRYRRPCEAFRGLGRVLAATRALNRPVSQASPLAAAHEGLRDASGGWTLDPQLATSTLTHSERAQFKTMGTMIDVSRNGVLNVPSVKFLCRKLALLGINQLQLYTEDTYKIEGEPFFGYLRGGYTQQDLREIDDYAAHLGIECVPCIQTLGHLGQVLQWPRFLAMRDTTEVLLAELPETYELLEKMISTATRPFRSKRIHLGQDETHGLGHGRYHTIFGQHNYKDPTRIFIEHLQQVNRICSRLQLEPMIWSDMLFCLNAKNNSLLGYYDSAQPSAPEVQGLPPNIDLVYWDYYHLREENYASRIESHKQLNKGKAPWMAAGAWTWTRFWTALPFTFATCRASQNACKQPSSGVENVFLTIWGDEGNEVDLWSCLPAWAYYADHGYTSEKEVDIPLLKARFDGVCGGNFDDFVVASRLDDLSPETQTLDDRVHFSPNTSKWMLWEEPFFGFVTPTTRAVGLDLEWHYQQLAQFLESRLSYVPLVGAPDPADAPPRSLNDHPFNARLRFPMLVARALSMKARLRERLSLAYAKNDWEQMELLAGRGNGPDDQSMLGDLRTTMKSLHSYHRQLWMSMYSPFGWETVDLRYGGVIARLETMHQRIIRFLDFVSSSRGTAPRRDGRGPVGGGGGEEATDSAKTIEGGVLLNAQLAEEDNAEYEEEVTSLPELEVRLEVAYPSADQLLGESRSSLPDSFCISVSK